MLQKPEKVGDNKLSRRQVCRLIGFGIGGITVANVISGCTSKVFAPLDESSQFIPLSVSSTVPFYRTLQANAGLDRRYLNKQRDDLRRIAKLLKKAKQDQNKDMLFELIQNVQQISYGIVNHWAEKDLLEALDEDLDELGLSSDVPNLEREYRWHSSKLLEVIRNEGSERLWRRWLHKTFKDVTVPSSLLVPIPPPPTWPYIWGVIWGVIVYILFSEETTSPHADLCPPGYIVIPGPGGSWTCEPTPPPPPPPPSSPFDNPIPPTGSCSLASCFTPES